MLPYLHRLTAILFYLVGTTFFLAYLLYYNEIGGNTGYWWLTIADLPLAMVAMLYGGSSLYLSVKPKNKDPLALKLVIFVPLMLIFAALVILNFWPLLQS